MLKQYPQFERGELITRYNKLKDSEKNIIEDYINYRRISSKSELKMKDYRRFLTQFRCIIQKDFSKITLKDLRDYLTLLNLSNRENTGKNDIKAMLKNFLRWKFKDWSLRFDELRDLKIRSTAKINHKKINSKVLLKKQDIEKLIRTEHTTYWRAFFMALYESGLRPKELRFLKWEDIDFNCDGDISELNIYATKTGRARVVYVKEATFYLKKLQEEALNEWVFPSKRLKDKPISKNAVGLRLTRLSKKALGREVFPYLLRHSRASELYAKAKENKMSKDSVLMFMGHNEDMSNVYTHLDSKQIKDILTKQVYNIEELPKEKKHELENQIELLKKELADRKHEFALLMDALRNKGFVEIRYDGEKPTEALVY